MSENSYKAYISYSHRDSKWAAWLHRALESYRLPRKLVGTQTAVGKVPPVIKPVFRDRDDLSSAADLGGIVAQALQDSENLIVICSPNSTASHWVNEEIRQFARLGRADRVFCVIVDGDPAGAGTAAACFPEALAEIGMTEPLAADVRQWADGKHLSKLKIISGMLGLPLDQLRRRDLQKRQRAWAVAAVAAIAVAVIMVTAVTSRITAQQRRDSGESLVAYKLGELRTVLNVKDDPENLSRLNQWSEQDLDDLIEGAGADERTLFDSAMELREQGSTFYYSGALQEALKKFEDSWALLAAQYRQDRNSQTTFFELGQAEFYIGQALFYQGEFDKAEKAFTAYAEISRRLIVMQPENADWVLEMAFALNNLGMLQKERQVNNPERHLQLMQSALEYNQIALVLDPNNDYYQSELGQSHAFLADAQIGVCDLEGALQSRQKNVEFERDILEKDRANTQKLKRLAYALSGYAVVMEQTGNIGEAISGHQQSQQLMEQVLLQTPDDRNVIRYNLHRQNRLVTLESYNFGPDAAWSDLEALGDEWRAFFKDGVGDASYGSEEHLYYLLSKARLAILNKRSEEAEGLLRDVTNRVVEKLELVPGNRSAEEQLMQAAFLYWELKHELPDQATLLLLPDLLGNSGRTRECDDAGFAVKQAVMFDDLVKAREFSDYLIMQGYRQPEFMRVCQQYALCEEQQ